MNKRKFLKQTLITGALLSFPTLGIGQEKRRAKSNSEGDLPLVEPGKGMAASVHYFHKTSDVKDGSLKKERQGVPFVIQTCANCAMYTKYGIKNGEEVGKCSLFAKQVVKGTGWCNSWAKKS